MRIIEGFRNASVDIVHSIRRFPLTVLFLIAFTFFNARNIEQASDNYTRYLFTILLGAFVSAVGQLIYERFYSSKNQYVRWGIMAVSIGLTAAYYLMLGVQEEVEVSLYIRTAVALLALFIAFIWIPTINNDRVAFHQSFLSAFKAIVTTFLFAGVLAIGTVLIYQAIHFLLFELDEDILWHLLNLIGSFFTPLYFLALTPNFIEGGQQNNLLVPAILERLLSFIVIPLLLIYTLVLIAYILINIGDDFWTDNLLEPLLVSYALIGIIVLLLSTNLNNRINTLFQNIFPKIFLPIVIFQTIASLLKIREMGITHGRYYVILFGVFAIVAGILFSLNRPKNYGWLAVVLLVLATISIVPPVDAFSVSKRNQLQLFEEKLTETGLLQNNQIVPSGEVPTEDKVALTKVTTYLSEMGYTDNIDYLPEDFEVYSDFSETFGFEMTYSGEGASENLGKFAYFENEYDIMLNIQEEDLFTRQYVGFNKEEDVQPLSERTFTIDENEMVMRILIEDGLVLEFIDNEGNRTLTVNADELFSELSTAGSVSEQVTIDKDFGNATFIEENSQMRVKILLIHLEDTPDYYSADFYLFIDIK